MDTLKLLTGKLTKAHPTDAGWDIYADEGKAVHHRNTAIISTQTAWQ